MENLVPLIIQLVSGALGGSAAGAVMKNLSLGTLGNSAVGILGGGLGGLILKMLGMATGAGDLDIGSIIASIASGGVGGGVLLSLIGFIRNIIAHSSTKIK